MNAIFQDFSMGSFLFDTPSKTKATDMSLILGEGSRDSISLVSERLFHNAWAVHNVQRKVLIYILGVQIVPIRALHVLSWGGGDMWMPML